VALAARGQRNMDTGLEPIADAEQQRQVERQARKIKLDATLAAAVLTLFVVLLPSFH
jgi:hypothetical protein